jgi:hypothetical protein
MVFLAIQSRWPERGNRGGSRCSAIFRTAQGAAIALKLTCSLLTALRGCWRSDWHCSTRGGRGCRCSSRGRGKGGYRGRASSRGRTRGGRSCRCSSRGREKGGVTFFLLITVHVTDYHWDRHLYFVIISHHAQTMTHTPPSDDSLLVHLLVVLVACDSD